MKKYLMIGGVVAALAVGIVAAAGVAAQETTPSPTEKAADTDRAALVDHYVEVLAGNLGVSVEELESALTQTQVDLINEKVADGSLTEEEAAEIIERIESAEGRLFPPFFGHKGGGHHGHFPRVIGNIFEAAAGILGLDVDALHEEVRAGSSLADIAEGQGLDVEAFKGDLQTALQAEIEAKVADGTITVEMGERLSAALANHIDRIVEGVKGDGPGRGFGPSGDGTGEDAEAALTF